MRLATTTSDFGRFCETHIERVKRVHDAGFKYIDLSLYNTKDDPLFYSDNWRDEVRALKEYAQKLGVKFVQAHSPNTNNLDGEEGYKDALWKTIRAIEICDLLGIPNMVIHADWSASVTEKEVWFKENKKFFEELFPTMDKCNVNVLCENSCRANMGERYYLYTGSDMREFVEYVNHPKFHGCWDVGHAHIEGAQYEDICALGEHLYAVHIHDNLGEKDEHLIPYLGTINMDEIMTALIDSGYKGYFTFEAETSLRSPKSWLAKRRVFEKNEKLIQPQLFMQVKLEELLYELGVYFLKTYDCCEE